MSGKNPLKDRSKSPQRDDLSPLRAAARESGGGSPTSPREGSGEWVEPVRQKWRKTLKPSLGAPVLFQYPTPELVSPTSCPSEPPQEASNAKGILKTSPHSMPDADSPDAPAEDPLPPRAPGAPPGAGKQLMCPMTGMLTMWRSKAAARAEGGGDSRAQQKEDSHLRAPKPLSADGKPESHVSPPLSPMLGPQSPAADGGSVVAAANNKLMSQIEPDAASDWPPKSPRMARRRSSVGSIGRTDSGGRRSPTAHRPDSQGGATEQTPEQAAKEAKAMNFLRRKFGLAPLPIPGEATSPEEDHVQDPAFKPLMGGKLAEILKRRAERAREIVQVRQEQIRRSGSGGDSSVGSVQRSFGPRRAGPQVYEKMGGYGESGTGNFLKAAGSTRNLDTVHHQARPPRSMVSLWSVARQGVLGGRRQAPMLRQQSLRGDDGGNALHAQASQWHDSMGRNNGFNASGVFQASVFNQSMISRRSAGASEVSSSTGSNVTGRRRRRAKGQKNRTRKAPAFSEYDITSHVPTIIDSWLRMQTLVDWQTIGTTFYENLWKVEPSLRDLFKTTDSLKQGQIFARMLNEMVSSIDDPLSLHEKLRVLAPMHRRKGVCASMMPAFAKAIGETISNILGNEMTIDIRTSWEWLWAWLQKSMTIVLEDAQVDATIVTQSWDLANDNMSEEALGCVMYDTLFSMAPNLKSEFPKPRQMLSVKFTEMLTTLVSFHGDPARMEEQIVWVAFRHLKYGAKAIHGPAIGQVVVATMQSAMGEDWTDELHAAWTELWETTSKVMIRLLEDAEKHGEVARRMWFEAKRNMTADTLGACICRKLIQLNHDLLTSFHKKHYSLPKREPPKVAPQSNLKPKESDVGDKEGSCPVFSDEDLKDVKPKRRKTVAHLARKLSDITSLVGTRRKLSSLLLKESSSKLKGDKPTGCAAAMASASAAVGSVAHAVSSCPRNACASIASKVSFSRRKGKDNESDDDLVDDDGEIFERKPGKGVNEAQAVGIEFLDMMNSIMDLLWEPEQQRENLTVLAFRLHELGILVSHFKQIGEGVKEAIKRCVTDFDEERQKAFDWLWKFVSSALMSGMNAMEASGGETIKTSWAAVKENKSVEEIGEEIFAELVKVAPHVVHLFNRPKKIQAAQFVSAVEMIVLFSRDPEQFFEDLKGLTIRHIKYGVKADYVKPFGKAILLAIQSCLGEAWTSDVKRAWEHLWLKVSCSVASCLSVGTSLVNVALVQGDLAKLVEAIECAPRGQRSQWLTEVTVHGSIVSPLYWAIRDGKFSMGKYILDDLLAIRADREAYYYGRETLWATHNDMIHILCKECPMLLEDVFDGLMWHAHTVLDGTIRVNYYIQELYGDPWSNKDPWKSPLATLTLEGEPQMFMHPAIAKVLDLKWNRFGRRGFLAMQLFWTFQLALYATGFVFLRNDCGTSSIAIRFLVGGISVCIFCFYIVFTMRQQQSGQIIPVKFSKVKFNCPRFFANPWNSTRLFTNAIMILVSFLEPCIMDVSMVNGSSSTAALSGAEEAGGARRFRILGFEGFGDLFLLPGGERRSPSCPLRGGYVNLPDVDITWMMVLSAITTFATCIQFVQLLTISDKLAAFTYTIGRMFEDVYRNLLVISIIMVSFAATLSVMREDSFQTFDVSIVGLLRTIVGLHSPSTTYVSSAGQFVIILFVVIIDIGFLNILIAQLALAYESLTKETAGFSRMNRAFTTVEIESLMPLEARRNIFMELGFDDSLEFDNGDSGPSGGIQVLEPASIRADSRYVPDRIMRFTGEASEHDPWPSEVNEEEEMAAAVDTEG